MTTRGRGSGSADISDMEDIVDAPYHHEEYYRILFVNMYSIYSAELMVPTMRYELC